MTIMMSSFINSAHNRNPSLNKNNQLKHPHGIIKQKKNLLLILSKKNITFNVF